MTTDEKRKAYQQFFEKTDAGQEFMKYLSDEIDRNHREGEKDGEIARDKAQKAAGLREVIAHISSLTAERRRPRM